MTRETGWHGYDWFKLVVAIILALLLLIFQGAMNPPQVAAPAPTAAPVAVAAPSLTSPAAGATVEPGAVTFSGTGTPGSQVRVLVDGAPIGTATVGADGSWSLDGTLDTPGERSVVVEALDDAGAVAATAAPVAVTVAEAAPAIAAPTLNADGAEGPGEFVFSGTGTPGSEVEVLVNGASVGTATVGADGNWQLPTTLEAGDFDIVARALDGGQPVAGAEASSTLNVPEPAVEIAAPTLELPTDPTAGEVVLGGTGTPGTALEILVDGVAVGTTTVGDDGRWELPVSLEAGSREVVVQALGEDGSVAAVSEAQQVEVGAPTLGGGAAPVSIDQPATGTTVPNAPITLGGTGTPGSTVEILAGDVVLGTATVGDDGRWSFEVTPDGPGEVSYSAREVGNETASEPVAITVADDAAPVASPGDSAVIVSPAEGDELPVGGPITISGTGPPGTSWEVLNGDQVLGTVTVGDDGTWSLEVTPEEGTASYSVRPVGESEIVGEPIRVTIGEAVATCDAIAVNCEAWVAREGGRTLRLRNNPGVSTETIELLPIGTQMTILEGPQTVDGFTWWRVRTVGGNEGWCAQEAGLIPQPD